MANFSFSLAALHIAPLVIILLIYRFQTDISLIFCKDYSAPPPNWRDDLSWSSGWVSYGECTSNGGCETSGWKWGVGRIEWMLRYPGGSGVSAERKWDVSRIEWWLRYLGGMAAVRHPEKMGCRQGGMAAERKWDVGRIEWRLRYPGGMVAVRHPEKMGCRPDRMAAEVSGWNGRCETSRENGMSAGYNCAEISGWNERCHKLRTLKNYGNLCICLTPRKPVLHNLYQVPTFLGMHMVPISENTKWDVESISEFDYEGASTLIGLNGSHSKLIFLVGMVYEGWMSF
uniref:Uncharacterized protein n=1 Tax=Vitis vinifera TaxID=29760 RepID=A5AZ73_VITVI|nr:hypothetical protein VITISV_004988 [Vitis vinifera]